MHEVDQFLEQDEVSWNHADAGANHDAVELLLFELGQNDRFRSLAKIRQANARVVANGLQMFLVGGHSRHHSCGVHAGKGGEGGIGEIDQCGIQADNQHTLPGGGIGILRRGLSFGVHIIDVCLSAIFLAGARLVSEEAIVQLSLFPVLFLNGLC